MTIVQYEVWRPSSSAYRTSQCPETCEWSSNHPGHAWCFVLANLARRRSTGHISSFPSRIYPCCAPDMLVRLPLVAGHKRALFHVAVLGSTFSILRTFHDLLPCSLSLVDLQSLLLLVLLPTAQHLQVSRPSCQTLLCHRCQACRMLLQCKRLVSSSDSKAAEGGSAALTFFICCCFCSASFFGLITREPVCLRWVLHPCQ